MALRDTILKRFMVVYLVIAAGFAAVIARIVYLQTVERGRWMEVAESLESRERQVEPNRGNIYTCDGELISATIPSYTLLMDTRVPALHQKEGALYKEHIDSLCICLSKKFGDKSAAAYRRMIDAAYRRGDGALRLYPEKVSYIDMMEVKSFPLFRLGRYKSGLFTREYTNRENLYGDLCARTIGNVYGAGQGGQYGLELKYDSILRGKPGVEKGTRAGTSWVYEILQQPEDGMDLVTTIDVVLQDICDKALRDELVRYDAARGCVVLMDVHTGEVRACVNLSRQEKGVYKEVYNMAVGDMSEPGSTFKTISLMVAMEDGVCEPTDSVDTGKGSYFFGRTEMTDHNKSRGGYGKITVSDALAYSSNVGVSRVINEHYGKRPGEFVDGIYAMKINSDMDIEIPGAGRPKIPHPDTYNDANGKSRWNVTTLPWMSIGYNVQMPPIYTLAFYNAIANDGCMVRPHFVKAIKSEGDVVREFRPEAINPSICSKATLRKIRAMLDSVVTKGTAKGFRSKEIAFSGKTGTAQLNYGGRNVVTHQVSFCGYFPSDRPRYSAIVVIRQPRVGYAGGYMPGNVFRTVAERVYAHENERSIYDFANAEEGERVPAVKAGMRRETEKALDWVGVDYEFEAVDWVRARPAGDGMTMEGENVPVITERYVPNVVGMGAKDAVYLIEKCGMRAKLTGRGKVVYQSVKNGESPVPGGTVYLTLR